jgi:hypothetical protein
MSAHDDALGDVASAASCGDTRPHGLSTHEAHAKLGSFDATSSLDHDALGGSVALGVSGYGGRDAGGSTAAGAVVSEHDGALGNVTSAASCGNTRPHGHSVREAHATLGSFDVTSSISRRRGESYGHGGLVGTPLASLGIGSAQLRGVGAARAASFGVQLLSHVYAPPRGSAPGASWVSSSHGVCPLPQHSSYVMRRASTTAQSACHSACVLRCLWMALFL